MFKPTKHRAAAALLLATLAVLICSGCEPASDTSSADGSYGCDPNGFGPLSGCESDPPDDDRTPSVGDDSGNPCPDEYGAVLDENDQVIFDSEGTYGVEPGSACERHIEQESAQFADDFVEELNDHGYEVSRP